MDKQEPSVIELLRLRGSSEDIKTSFYVYHFSVPSVFVYLFALR